jgi:hypothetical protein
MAGHYRVLGPDHHATDVNRTAVRPSDYLRFLATYGYPRSPREEVFTGKRASEGVDSEYCSFGGDRPIGGGELAQPSG